MVTLLSKLLKEVKWPSLSERRARQIIMLLQKARMNQTRIPIDTLANNTRKENTYIVPHSRVNAHLYSFFPSTIRLWNSLPDNIRRTDDITNFKHKININTGDYIISLPFFHNTQSRLSSPLKLRLNGLDWIGSLILLTKVKEIPA